MPPNPQSTSIGMKGAVEAPLAASTSGKKSDHVPLWTNRDAVQERFLKQKMKRISFIKNESAKHYDEIRESRHLYEGKSHILNEKKDKRDLQTVVPIGRSFVDAKSAEEIKAMNEYEYTPVKDTADSWKVNLIKDLDKHAATVTKRKAKRHRMIRGKNIDGLSIKRKGYRKTMRWIKDRVDSDDDARGLSYKMRLVPMYDDLIEEVISPLEFAIEPGRTMDDAMDCCHTHIENKEVFLEIYGNDPRFINIDKVKPGVKFKFDDQGEFVFDSIVPDDGIVVEEYFNKILDEWVLVANGVLISPVEEIPVIRKDHNGNDVPVLDENQKQKMQFFAFPLPDDHKELPFVSYHNHAKFAVESFGDPAMLTGSSSNSDGGDEISNSKILNSEEVFWTKGDCLVIKDLIDLNTAFSRAMFRNAKLAAEAIIATKAGKRFKNKHYKGGDQAVGMMGQFEVVQVGKSILGDIVPMLDWLMSMKVLAIGIDPRSLTQAEKTRTATEAAIMRETALVRLEAGIEYNEEHGEIRDGVIGYKLMQQYYSKPEVVRITGLESEEELNRFDEIEYDTDKTPISGKRYRLIESSIKLKEKKRKTGDTYKFYLSREESGVSSFLSRPEYIRASEIKVRTQTVRRAGEIRAINAQQSMELIKLYLEIFTLARPGPDGSPPVIQKEDLPNLPEELKRLQQALGRPQELKRKEEEDEDQKKSDEAEEEIVRNRKPIADVERSPLSSLTPTENAVPA